MPAPLEERITAPLPGASRPLPALPHGVLAFTPRTVRARQAPVTAGDAAAEESEAVGRFRTLPDADRRLVLRILRTLTGADAGDPSDRLFGQPDLV